MRFTVIREFKDKFRQVRYYPGDEYENADPERIAFLQQNGYLGEEINPPSGTKRTRKVKDNGASG